MLAGPLGSTGEHILAASHILTLLSIRAGEAVRVDGAVGTATQGLDSRLAVRYRQPPRIP